MKRAVLTLALAAAAIAAACSAAPPIGPSRVIPALSRTRFLAFGDSLTAGEVTAPVGGHGLSSSSRPLILVPTASYPSRLLPMLQERYQVQAPTLVLTNAGKPGEYSFDGRVRFAEAIAAERPEVVLLLHGTNDLAFQNSDLPAGSLLDMTIQGRQAGAQVFLSTLMVFKPGGRNSPNAALVDDVNAKIKAIAASQGAVLIDLFDTLLPEAAALIGSDGLHPTEAGYKRIADVFFASIQANLEVK